MARRIEFLAPVEAMRGNLSGKQALKYPTKNNSAWDAPSDKRSYSINYNTRYIGAKKSANGLKYFAVKKRAAVTNTPAQRNAQALLGASKHIADDMLRDLTILPRLVAMYRGYAEHGYQYQPAWIPSDLVQGSGTASIRKYLMRNIRDLTLIPKNKQFVVQPQSGSDIIYNNPWRFDNNSGTKVENIQFLIEKFWKQLAMGDPCYFYIAGNVGIADEQDSFNDIISGAGDSYNYTYNVLGLTTETVDSVPYVKYGNLYVIDVNGDYVKGSDIIAPGETYYVKDIAPSE